MYDNKVDKCLYNKYLCNQYFLGAGKETTAYKYHDDGTNQDFVIKIFHDKRISPFSRLSEEGLITLSHLPLKCFNIPLLILEEEGRIVGYIEKYIEDEFFSKEAILNSLDDIKNDIVILSQNGFTINDLFYNYMVSNGKLVFFDMTSYEYIHTNVPFLLQKFEHKNIETMNVFLIGSLLFDAFKKGSQCEYTKIYKATEYNQTHCKNQFFGDYLQEFNKHI